MATLLHIQASPRIDRSYSIRTARAFLDVYREANPQDLVRTLDLATAEIPDFDATAVAGKYRIMHGEPHSLEEAEAWKAVARTVAEFKEADKVVISSPMWNFGIPYRLKQYFDVIVQPGLTFSFSPETGYEGLVTGRPATLILARGGEYGPGTEGAAFDFQRPYLEAILGFMGFDEIDTILVEPTLQGGPQVAGRKMEEAVIKAREKARVF